MSDVFSSQAAKAYTAAIMAGLSALAVVVAGDGSASLATLTLAQWITVALAVVGAFAATYNVPRPPAAPADDHVGEHEAGLTSAQVEEIVAAKLAATRPSTLDWETKQ